jgi:apoptosis-inducing factor 3
MTMGESAAQLPGPDFEQGVDVETIPDGGMLLGHAAGEGVIVTRSGTEVCAVGATCTHYHAPLADGLFAEGTLRCPWHHARFDVRTGEAVGPPALNPLPCWNVERKGGRLRVTGKRTPLPKAAPKGAPNRIVIVGAGAAGNAAAEMLRREGYTGDLTLIGADPDLPYDRPNLSKDYLAGTAPEDWIPLRSADFYAEQGIRLLRGTPVTKLDVNAKKAILADGSVHPFDVCLLATGADPVKLPGPGTDLPHVHTLRTLAHSRAIVGRTGSVERAVVIGASFIGLEVAAALRARNIAVDVVAPEARPLERVMGPQLGDFVRALHHAHGVTFHLGQTVTKIAAKSVDLSGGTALAADLVVMGVGVRPSIALAEQAGLSLDRGVLVNEFLETSIPGIFAAGDIARWPDPYSGKRIRVEHWAVAEGQGYAAAQNMLGRRVPYRAVPFFWSQHYDVALNYVGHAETWDRIQVSGSLDARDAAVSFYEGNRVTAVVTLWRDRVSLQAEAALERGDNAALRKIVA